MTFEGRPTGKVPWDWLVYFHQRRRADCGGLVEYHDPETRAHPVIPRDAVRLFRTEEDLREEDADGPLHRRLRERVIEAVMRKDGDGDGEGAARVVVLEEPFPDLGLLGFVEEAGWCAS